jgi:hypothetical protein
MIAVNIIAVRAQTGKFLVDHHSCPLMFVMKFPLVMNTVLRTMRV